MRERDHGGILAERLRRKVGHVVLELPRCERRRDRLGVDDLLAREIEEDRARVHQLQVLRVDQVLGHGKERDVQRDELARLQHLLDRMRFLHLRGQAPRGVDRDLGIVAEHVHAELDRGVGDQAPDLAEADDT